MKMETTTMTKKEIAVENAELIRRGYKAFNSADMKTLTELFDEKASWHTPGHSSISGDFKGRNAVFTQFGRYGNETNGTFKAILQDVFINEDGHAIGFHRNIGERNGKKLDVLCCIHFNIRDGKVIYGREYFFDLYAWDAFWS